MIYRIEVLVINVNFIRDEFVKFVINEKYIRFLVYEEILDKIVGIFYVKDLLKYLLEYEDKNEFDIYEILRDLFFVF